jgi:ribosomal protein S18 acetylase RimI-like enzyme
MTISLATHEDIHSLAILNKEVQNLHAKARPDLFKLDPDLDEMADFFSEMLDDGDNRIFINRIDGQPVAYLYCQIIRRPGNAFMFPYSVVYIHHIAVKMNLRGRGCGRKLIQAVYQLANDEDIPQVALDVWSFNSNAQAFFNRMGFQTFNHRMNLWIPGDQAGTVPSKNPA